MTQLGTEGHFPHSRLGDSGVLNLFAFLVRLEFFDSELAVLAMATNGFVDAAIGATADEADDFVAVNDPYFALISPVVAYSPVTRICILNQYRAWRTARTRQTE